MTYFVNSYETDRLYGGPEEGGWWYDVGSPAGQSYGPYASNDEAMDVYYALQEEVDLQNEGRPPLGSVLSDGRFTFMVEEHEPRPWPETTPFFE